MQVGQKRIARGKRAGSLPRTKSAPRFDYTVMQTRRTNKNRLTNKQTPSETAAPAAVAKSNVPCRLLARKSWIAESRMVNLNGVGDRFWGAG